MHCKAVGHLGIECVDRPQGPQPVDEPVTWTNGPWAPMRPSSESPGCANCGRALDASGSDHCSECDHMFEAGVEAACAAIITDDAARVMSEFTAIGKPMAKALAEHVKRSVRR